LEDDKIINGILENWDFEKFANALSTIYPHIFTPTLVNASLKNITLNPQIATDTDIQNALDAPKENEQNLIGYGQDFELKDMLYKRQILYLGNMLAWNIDYVCTNAEEEKDYTSKAYKKDEKVLRDFLDKFDFKKEFTVVLRQLLRQESYYCCLRDEGEKYTLQELPQAYCLPTARWDYGLLFDFNLYWFMQAGVNIKEYSKPMQTRYRKAFGTGKKLDYNPNAKLNQRTGTYIYYTQTSPEENFWMWKLTPEIITQIPFFAAMFPDLVLRPVIRNLQKNKFIQEATKILVAIIGFNKDNKSGNVRDAINVSPENVGKFMNLMRQGINSAIATIPVPFESVQPIEFKADAVNLLDSYTKTTVGSGGNNARLLYNSSDKSNIEETKNSIAIDEAVVEFIYPWFADFINYYVNKKTRVYKFKVDFSGTNLPASKKKDMDDALDLAEIGIVYPSLFAKALRISPFDLERKMAMAKAKGFVDNLTPILKASQMSAKGAPPKDDGNLGEAGSITRGAGSNLGKGG
jgi:hypothetical protein